MSSKANLFTRREFVQTSALASTSAFLPAFLANGMRTALAADGAGQAIPGFADDRVLVVLQLSGGNDGLNCVVPFGDDAYYGARPQIAIPKNKVLGIDDYLGLNDNMTAMRELYDQGVLAIVNGVGYPNPDHSHFRSMEIWHTASDSLNYETEGWLGNYFNRNGDKSKSPMCAVNIGAAMPAAFAGTNEGVAFEEPTLFRWFEGKGGDTEQAFRAVNGVTASAGGAFTEGSTLEFMRHTTANLALSSDRVVEIGRKGRTSEYPNGNLGRDLQIVANMIVGGLPTRVFYVNHGGFDTHANQVNQHGNLLRQLSDGLAAFYRDLKKTGQSRRVVVMAFSEFGRRVYENGSRGTDHGVAGPMFVMGDPVKGGLHGKYPSLSSLDKGDLVHTVDFRSVYATMIENWFKADAAKVVRKKFKTLDLLK